MGTNLRMTRAVVALLAIAGVAMAAGCRPGRGGGGGAGGTGGVPAAYSATGPSTVATASEGQTTFYYPTNLGAGGTRHAVILWGNGTGGSPSTYDGLLRHFASHGFIVAAANTANPGSGREMLAGLDLLARGDTQGGSRWYGKVDLANVGATGHSQGGGGAVNTIKATDTRVKTAFPITSGRSTTPAGIRAPVLYLAGSSDTIATPTLVRGHYQNSSGVPAAYAELAGATHFTPTGGGGAFRGAAVAWASWQLRGDTTARSVFVGPSCTLCNNPAWNTYLANALLT